MSRKSTNNFSISNMPDIYAPTTKKGAKPSPPL